MTSIVRPLSHDPRRLPASSFSNASTADPPGPFHSHPPPPAVSHLLPLHSNASGPLSTARRERSSKPIMDWLAKKWGATRKVGNDRKDETKRWKPTAQVAMRPMNGLNVPPPPPPPPPPPSTTTKWTTSATTGIESPNTISFPLNAYPQFADQTDRRTFATRSSISPDNSPTGSRSASEISLAESYLGIEDPDNRSFVPSQSEAGTGMEDDGSLRPIPPSHPSSPARSAFSVPRSQYRFRGAAVAQSGRPLSTSTTASSLRYAPSEAPSKGWRSFGSNGGVTATSGGSASTKPTTVFSTDTGVLPPAHIAEVPMDIEGVGNPPIRRPSESAGMAGTSPIQPRPRMNRTLTRDSTISAHPSPLGAIPPTSSDAQDSEMMTTTTTTTTPSTGGQIPPPSSHPLHITGDVQAPKHSHHHPRYNPRPDALPQANASTLTLASSTFAMPSAGMNGTPSHHARSVAGSHRFSSMADEDTTVDEVIGRQTGGEEVDFEDVPTTPIAQSSPTTSHFIPARRSLDIHAAILSPADGNSIRDGNGTSHRGPASSYYYGRHRLDDDASVRALRRRGSWESGESKFSWVGLPQVLNTVPQSSGASGRSVQEKEKSSLRGMTGVVG